MIDDCGCLYNDEGDIVLYCTDHALERDALFALQRKAMANLFDAIEDMYEEEETETPDTDHEG